MDADKRLRQELVVLFQKLADHTLPECRFGCRVPLSCCSPEYCGMAIEYAKEEWGVELPTTSHPTLPLMGPHGCTAPPHLRPLCTKHVCCINGLGFKPGNQKWTEEYFALTDKIDDVGNQLMELEEPMNQINVIKPYLWEGIWVFDDPAVGLVKEALVSGMPELILAGCEKIGIKNPEGGFVAVFSKDPFPDAKIVLEWVREDVSGNWYKAPALNNMEGWLCPALFKYFESRPDKIYIDLRPSS